MKPWTIEKAGRVLEYVDTGTGRVLVRCDCDRCERLPVHERYYVLPCGHHGTITDCSCPLRDKRCNTCGRVWVPVGNTWYELASDPHASQDGKEAGE